MGNNDEFDFSNEQMLSCFNIPKYASSSSSFDIDKFLLRTQTYNPSEFETPSDDTADSIHKKGNKNRYPGNREAVRKYREKKKAKIASLEDEVVRLRVLNQQLMKRLKSHASLEAEVARLKCLLVDVRGRIDGEIGSFPYHNIDNSYVPSTFVMNQCDDQFYSLNHGPETMALNGQDVGDCGPGNVSM